MNTIIRTYFPDLSQTQYQQFQELGRIYPAWNAKINVISRKDIDHLYLHHVLHSLFIARTIPFLPGASVMDAGTGGGFPGIPLAIFFPEVEFTLVDSIEKKIRVVQAIAGELNLKNVRTIRQRVEQIHSTFNFIVGRAITTLPGLIRLTGKLIKPGEMNQIPHGILYLKGGNEEKEIQMPGWTLVEYPINRFFQEDFFSTKKLIHLYHTQ